MTENPLYRRVYGADNPLLRSWRPPSESYPQTSLNSNAAQDLRNLFGNFFAQNAAQNYSPQYQPYQVTPQINYNPYANNIPPNQQAINRYVQNEIAPPVLDHATQQLAQKALLGGATFAGLYNYGKQYAPFALAWMGAHDLTRPIANGINKFANSPVGKTFNKTVDKVIDWIW